jgi:hypothetical protein
VCHITDSEVANPTSLQIQSLESSPNYDHGKRIEITLRTTACTKSDVEKWLCFQREHEISKP